ncbi:MAG: hypothetical protein LBU35_02105 [Holosporales bacterium]|jgi:hypothetical protein|nr:hypothetical protein [Holosporales bacterium]
MGGNSFKYPNERQEAIQDILNNKENGKLRNEKEYILNITSGFVKVQSERTLTNLPGGYGII